MGRLLTGAAAAIAACAILALLAASACRPGERRGEPPPGESFLPQLAGGTFLAAGSWIDLRQRHVDAAAASTSTLAPSFLATVESGWGGTETWGTWGLGERTELRFFLRWVKPYRLHLTCRAAAHPDGRPQTVGVVFNGRRIATLEVGSDWERHRVEVPAGVLSPGDNRIELAYGFHLAGTPGVDPRPLALAIEEIGLLAPDQRPKEARAEGGAEPALDDAADALRLERSGTYLVPLRVPRDAAALEVTLRSSGRAARLRAGVMTTDGSEDTAFVAGGGRQRIALAAYRGRDVFLVFDADLPHGGRLTLESPRLSTVEALSPRPATAPPLDAGRPDIVLVVLDAARADRFGAYGYERDTTPHIDRLAARSLVFQQVLAECPYTSCSMPNLLAGLSFPQHGVVAHGLALADRVDTLAEVLSQLGYRTLGITGNPNSSRLTGSDQGFDEFHETWKLASPRDRIHPGFLTRLAIERLGHLDERPLFLMLHYVPPHEPYDPDPPFDLFGDPDYAGPVVGEQRFVQSVFAREIELDDADLAELSALYDGNLRMADHWVGRLIDALVDAGRWDDTLFVLTSDHGEAFDEHGYLGHNDTVHEEMLRVPLILRLPRDERPAGVDLARLASLGDLMPTLLARLDRVVPVGVRGSDLLAAPPLAAADRLVFLRSAHEAGVIFGVRSARFKLMARQPASWDPGGYRLFDLAADPQERSDLAPRHRLLQAALALRLERALSDAGQLEVDAQPAAMSPEDEAMLRSLGYLPGS